MKKVVFVLLLLFPFLLGNCATKSEAQVKSEVSSKADSITIEWLKENAATIFSGITYIGNTKIDRSKYTFYNFYLYSGAMAGKYTIVLQNVDVEKDKPLADGEIREFKLMYDSRLLQNNRSMVNFSTKTLDGWESLSGVSCQYLLVASVTFGDDRPFWSWESWEKGDQTSNCIISTFVGDNIPIGLTRLVDSSISSLDEIVEVLNNSVQEKGMNFRMFYTVKVKKESGRLIKQCVLDLLEWY
jgi:hypothetical protein